MISVIVPIYNSEKTITRCVKSIQNQTYKNIEIILVDDGSIDNSLKMCKEFAKTDHRIKIIQKNNGGVSSARNIGIESAEGEYIMFCDADDYVSPNWCSILEKTIKKNLNSWIVSNIYIVDNKGIINSKCSNNDMIKLSYFDIFKMGISAYSCNKIYRRDIISKYVIRFREDCSFSEDVEFNVKYCLTCNDIVYIKEPLYYYVNNSESLTHKYYPNTFEHHLFSYTIRLKLISEEELKDYCDIWLYRFYYMLENVFDKRNQMSFFAKMNYNQKMINTTEFKHCLNHAAGKTVNVKERIVLNSGNYYLFWLLQRLIKKISS